MIRRMLFTLLTMGLAGAVPRDKRLSEEEAKKLVLTTLRSQRMNVERIESGSNNDRLGSGFYSFRAVGPFNPLGSNTIGNFLVNPATGDVFNGLFCEEYHTPALRKLQTAIRKRFGISQDDYRKLRRPSPLCDSN